MIEFEKENYMKDYKEISKKHLWASSFFFDITFISSDLACIFWSDFTSARNIVLYWQDVEKYKRTLFI